MFTAITACRICRNANLDLILNFGNMPLANRYVTKDEVGKIDPVVPLQVVLCQNCGCIQLRHTVEPEILFGEYCYTSSTSGSLAEHFQQYAVSTTRKLGLSNGYFVVGIGGNDGPLERAYQDLGFKVLNVEASRNIAELSKTNGVPTVNAWFTPEVARSIVLSHGHADLITCNNCFAHIPDVNEAVNAIKILLKPGGWFICENAYWANTVAGNNFDQIYHEHCFYWTVKALNYLFRLHGMTISDVELNESQGGSMRVFVKNRYVPYGISHLVAKEEDAGLFRIGSYANWWDRIMTWKRACRSLLESLHSVCCYGVPAKFTMLSEQLKFTAKQIQYAVEDSPIKVNRFTPGAHIPIVPRQHFVEHPTNYCIITATNYADLIVKSNPQYKGKWIVLLPEPGEYVRV